MNKKQLLVTGENLIKTSQVPSISQNKQEISYSSHIIKYAWISFPLSYLYIYTFFYPNPILINLLAILFLLFTESYFAQLEQKIIVIYTKTHYFLMAAFLLISLIMPHLNFEYFDNLTLPLIHLIFVFYLIIRANFLTQNEVTPLFIFDYFVTLTAIPFNNLLTRLKMIKQSLKESQITNLFSMRRVIISLFTLTFTFFILYQLIVQLGELNQFFKTFMEPITTLQFLDFLLFAWFHEAIEHQTAFWILSIPVGAYFFAILYGMGHQKNSNNNKTVIELVEPNRIFPLNSALFILISVNFLYIVFLVFSMIQTSHFFNLHSLSIVTIRNIAVDGFWQVVNIALISFIILTVFYFFLKSNAQNNKLLIWLSIILLTVTIFFIAIALIKLVSLYIVKFGLTEKRLFSTWLLLQLLFICCIKIYHYFKKINFILYTINFALASFVILLVIALNFFK